MGTTHAVGNAQSSTDFLATFMPDTLSATEEIAAALSRVNVLDGLSPEELLWLATHGKEHRAVDGQLIFRSGEPVQHLTFLLNGEIHVRRIQSGPILYFIGRSGQLTGKLPFSRMKSYGGDGYAAGDVWTLDISEAHFPAMLAAIPSMAQRCVSVLLDRAREVTRIEQQSEKLNALGKLAANLSHELNNPASAARSAATNLWSELRNYGDQKYRLGSLCFSEDTQQQYRSWVEEVRALVPLARASESRDGMTISSREEVFARWLQANGVPEAFTLSPVLAETRIEVSHLDRLVTFLPSEALPITISAFTSALKAERMTDAVMDSTARIFDLITAIKDYSYMDQAPIQDVDIPQAIENTLTMLNSRLNGISIVREFEPDTPIISAYGSELNQVWTALIENAVEALGQLQQNHGVLRLRTALSGSTAVVEIWDNGPGIDPDIRSRIFEPFFTTKAVGMSLGLGLDTANRIVTKHRGQITVKSKPGETCFQVRLPIEPTGAY